MCPECSCIEGNPDDKPQEMNIKKVKGAGEVSDTVSCLVLRVTKSFEVDAFLAGVPVIKVEHVAIYLAVTFIDDAAGRTRVGIVG